MTGRPPLEIGEHGSISTSPTASGKFQARTKVRDRDGRVREVTATGKSMSAAVRALDRALGKRRSQTTIGITSETTAEALAEVWLDARQRATINGGKAAAKPQTLAAYSSAIRLLIVPTLGGVKVREMRVGLLDGVLGDLEDTGVSTAQMRSVLSQMLALAVRHEALMGNPMPQVTPMARDEREVEALTVDLARALRAAVSPATLRKPGKRGQNNDLRDVVDFGLGTGCRIGEALAVQWKHIDLDASVVTALISGTLVEPRKGYVETFHRQETVKGKYVRKLILPDHVVNMLQQRRSASRWTDHEDPVFACRTGTWVWPANIRTRLRIAVAAHPGLDGTTPHTLRRTVGTLVAHERGLDAARDQLGHAAPGITGQKYVAPRIVAPDLREILDQFFAA